MGQTTVSGVLRPNENIQFGAQVQVNAGAAATGFSVVDPTDSTKKLIFDLSALTTGTTTTFAPSTGGAEVTENGVQSLTNKSLEDTTTYLYNHTSPTKKAQFLCSGITAGQTRVMTIPDSNGTIAYLAGSTFTTATLTAPTIAGGTLTGTLTATGATISAGTLAPTTLTVPSGTALTNPAITGGTIVRTSQKFITCDFARAGGTAGWLGGSTVTGDIGYIATLPVLQTASTLVIQVSGLHVGDTLTGFYLIGSITSGGTTGTLDADFRKITAGTDASVGAISQISTSTTVAINSGNSTKTFVSPLTILDTHSFYVLVTATSGADVTMILQSAVAIVTTT